jgi:hypothetical protein
MNENTVFVVSRYEHRMEDTNIVEPTVVCKSIESLQKFTENNIQYIKKQMDDGNGKSFTLGKSLSDMWLVKILEII